MEERKGKQEYYQNNALVQARKHYGIIEHRLFRLALSAVNPQFKGSEFFDCDFKSFHMDTSDVIDLFGHESRSIYDKLKMACQNMIRSYIEVGTSKSFLLFPVFEYIEFDAEKGLDLKFNNKLKPYILELSKGNFTKSFLQLSFDLSGKRSLILLEMMLQYRGKAKGRVIERKIETEELKFVFDIDETAYKGRMNNFRQIVLNPAIREINEKTAYYIEPDYQITYGRFRTIKAFTFQMRLPKDEFMTNLFAPLKKETKTTTDDNKDNDFAKDTIASDARDCSEESVSAENDNGFKSFTEEEIAIIVEMGKLGIRAEITIEKLRTLGMEFVKYWLNETKKNKNDLKNPAGFLLSKLENPEENMPVYKDEDFTKALADIKEKKRANEKERMERENQRREQEKKEAEERRAKRIKISEEQAKIFIKMYRANNNHFPIEVEEYLKANNWTTTEFLGTHMKLLLNEK